MKTTVRYAGIDLEVVGTIIPATKGGMYEPSQPPFIDEMEILINDIHITELISDEDFSRIEKLALEGLS